MVIALTIFLVGFVAVYIYAINFLNEGESTLSEFFDEAGIASNLMLSEGSPENWNLNDAEVPGILTSKKINQTKLENFNELSVNNYTQLKKLLNIKNNIYIHIPQAKVNGTVTEFFGLAPSEYENLVKIERFAIYENQPKKIVFYIWN